MKCWISELNAQGSRGIIVVVQVGAVKIYVAAVEALRKKERQGETQETLKLLCWKTLHQKIDKFAPLPLTMIPICIATDPLSRSCPGAASNSVEPISLTMQLRNFCSQTNITSMISPNKFCIYIIIWGGTLISFSFGGNRIGKRQGERPEEMGLLTIIKKVKKKEKEMRILMVYEFWP